MTHQRRGPGAPDDMRYHKVYERDGRWHVGEYRGASFALWRERTVRGFKTRERAQRKAEKWERECVDRDNAHEEWLSERNRIHKMISEQEPA